MRPCPRCGAELVIAYPHGPTTWVESCPVCGYEGGGTAYFIVPHEPGIENDDWPILSVCVVDPGPQRSRMFQLYREVLSVLPEQAKDLLSTPRVEVARGPRMVVDRHIDKFRAAGAKLEISRI